MSFLLLVIAVLMFSPLPIATYLESREKSRIRKQAPIKLIEISKTAFSLGINTGLTLKFLWISGYVLYAKPYFIVWNGKSNYKVFYIPEGSHNIVQNALKKDSYVYFKSYRDWIGGRGHEVNEKSPLYEGANQFFEQNITEIQSSIEVLSKKLTSEAEMHIFDNKLLK